METMYYFADVLGWTALHSIWQIVLICLLLKLLLQFLPDKDHNLRLALFGGAALLIVASTFSTLLYLIDLSSADQQSITLWPETYYMYYAISDTGSDPGIWAWFGQYSHWMGIFWLCGTLSLGIYWAGGYYFLKKLQRNALPLQGKYYDFVKSWSREAGLSNAPEIRISRQIASPVLTGFLQPIILLPSGMLHAFSEEQIECILRHEWLHWKRHDHLINLSLAFFESVFFFHPLTWWLTKEIRHLQELIVDRETVKHTQQPLQYAKTLYEAQKLALQPSVGMTAFSSGKGKLLNRIEQVLSPYPHSKNKLMKTHNIGIVFLSGIFISLISLAAYSMDTNKTSDSDSRLKVDEANMEVVHHHPISQEDQKVVIPERSNDMHLHSMQEIKKNNGEIQVLPYRLPQRTSSAEFQTIFEGDLRSPIISFERKNKQYIHSVGHQDRAAAGFQFDFKLDTFPSKEDLPSKEEWEEFGRQMQEFSQRMAAWGQEYAQKIQKHMPPQDSLQKMISELQSTMQEEQWTEEEMEVFERKMEAYGQRMEEWGMRFEQMMEEWAEKYEQEMEKMDEEMDSIEKPPLPPPPPSPPLPEPPEEPKGEE